MKESEFIAASNLATLRGLAALAKQLIPDGSSKHHSLLVESIMLLTAVTNKEIGDLDTSER
jgi:hypothetical protein